MIRPAHFGANPQTAASNVFQGADHCHVSAAEQEFDAMVAVLTESGVRVLQLPGCEDPALPDEIFPNNWFSAHRDGTLVLYPMESELRRLERRPDLTARLRQAGFVAKRCHDLSHHEQEGRFLEGTGSLVLDHPGRRAFACRSSRTHPMVVQEWTDLMGFRPILFDASFRGRPVYHTNVVLSLGSRFAVLATELVDESQRPGLIDQLGVGGRELIPISAEQTAAFAGNMLELAGRAGPVIALSQRASDSLDGAQRKALQRYGRLLPIAVPTIEALGGGSVRCMLAEIPLALCDN